MKRITSAAIMAVVTLGGAYLLTTAIVYAVETRYGVPVLAAAVLFAIFFATSEDGPSGPKASSKSASGGTP